MIAKLVEHKLLNTKKHMATELIRGVNHFHSLLDKPIKLERSSQLECKSESAKTEVIFFLIYPTPAFNEKEDTVKLKTDVDQIGT